MISMEMEKLYPSGKTLVKECVASRVHAKDASLYGFSDEARECASNFMGWADLASNPPCSLAEIKDLAKKFIDAGMKTAILIGQGGSTQAAMTMTKYDKFNKDRAGALKFRTLDSDSPVRLRRMLAESDPKTTLVIVSSKSGGTLEMHSLFSAVRAEFGKVLDGDEICSHFVAITDPGSELAQQAIDERWGGLLYGEPTVGGRFSALSVFGLFPAALVGIDIDELIAHGLEAERQCSEDSIDNPAIGLAAFLYDNWYAGRDKFSFFTQKCARVFGLWVEQLVAESTGKQGLGILPQVEVDPLLLCEDAGDCAAVIYQTQVDLWDEMKNYEMGLSCINSHIPRMSYRVDSVYDLVEHFVMWEYATAMCGYLMQVCPFDQPDVASAKAKVLELLDGGLPEPDFVESLVAGANVGRVEVRLSDCCSNTSDVRGALRALLASIRPHDYFAMNVFVPFMGEGRREALESIRHRVAEKKKVTSCLEIGPRYLHSTGQLQKGGPNSGVFLVISADELKDVPLSGEKAQSLGQLAKAQAVGDALTLAERGRRCLHLHLPDNSGVTLRCLAKLVEEAL